MSETTRRTGRAAEVLRSAFIDGSILGGAASMAFGAWQIYPPAGFLVAGSLLLWLGVSAALRGGPRR
jgi:uncharacterized membrane protein YoaK (UPF0700 family)